MKRRNIDYIEAQSFALAAETVAVDLLKKHKGRLTMVKKDEALSKRVPKKFRDEVVWAATWMDP